MADAVAALVMAEAEPVIRAVLPDADVPTSVRSSGPPVVHGSVTDLDAILGSWLAANTEGIACVIGTGWDKDGPFDAVDPERPRVRLLSPELAKGLEFDLVVLLDPEGFGSGVQGAVDPYVAMTRATQQLVILTGSGLSVSSRRDAPASRVARARPVLPSQ